MEDNTLKSGHRTGYKGWGVQFTNETIELEGIEGVMEYLESSEEDNGYNNDYTCNSCNSCESDYNDNDCEGIYNEECNENGYEWYQGCCGCYLIGDDMNDDIDDGNKHMNECSYDKYNKYLDNNKNNRNISIDDLLESKRSSIR